MRAGEPDAMDRMVGFAFGGLAVQLIQRGETARMVTLTDGNYGHVPIDTLLNGTQVGRRQRALRQGEPTAPG